MSVFRVILKRALPLLLFLLVLPGSVHPAVPLSVVHWGTDQGLEPGPLLCVIQTRDGYLWLGGEEGLMRFDGVRAVAFSTRNTPELKAKSISALHEDENGGLWVGTAGGGLAYRTAQGKWQWYGPEAGLENERVSAITQDSKGRLWIGTDGGGIFTSDGDGKFKAFAQNDVLPTRHVESLFADENGTIWVGSGTPLCRIHDEIVDATFAPSGEVPPSSFAIVRRPDGALWVGGREGLFLLKDNQFTRVLPEFNFGYVQALNYETEGRLWVGTRTGLVRLDGEKAVRLSMKDGLSGNMIKSIYRDAEGSVWVTGEAPGADQIRNARFATLTADQAHFQQMVTAIYEDSAGSLWVGGHDGLRRIDERGSRHWSTADGLDADLVFSICEGKNEMWVGTAGGLNRFKDGQWSLFGSEDGMPHRVAWSLYTGSGGEIWAGTLRGLVRIGNGEVEVFSHDDGGLSHSDVRAICEDAAGRLWVGTSYGLNVREGGQFKQFLEGAPGVPFNAVLALHADSEGDVWIGTMEQGLFRWRDGRFSRFHTAVGLHDDLILRILEDDLGKRWMSCNRGIFRVSKADLNAFADGKLEKIECTVFGKADGLPSIECNGTFQPAGWKSKDGRLWFPTSKGMAVVDPGKLPRNTRPPVIIEEVRASGKPIGFSERLKLGPGARDISIRYTALSFAAPNHVQFRYRLDGLDDGWLAETTERSARYTRLPPGDYTFRVAAANNDGVWNDAGASLAFQVLPFWWQTRSFMVLASVTVAGLIGGVARLWTARRYRQRMAELEHQHALERERNRIATDLHDDVGSNLGSIALLSASARKHVSGEAGEDFFEIQQIAESTAESMRDIVWFINSTDDELPQLALRMKETAGRILGEISWGFDAPPSLPAGKLSTEFKRHFFLIFKEALHNIRKHSRASRVRIELSAGEGRVDLSIMDDGVGFVDSLPHPGLGLNSMRRRAAALGWVLTIGNGGNGGNGGATVRLVASLSAHDLGG